MKEVTDLVEDLVNAIDFSIEFESITAMPNNVYRINTCNTKWARVGKKIILFKDTVEEKIKITNIEEDTYIEIVYTGADTDFTKIELTSPFFISGTKTSTNNEWSRAGNNLLEKTPLIWLYPNYSEKIYGLESSLERSITMSIAFLDETNPKFQKNKEHIDNAVKPCNKLKELFIKSINKNVIYRMLVSYDTKTFSRFGVETDSGVVQNILDANLSGVILTLTIDKFKEPCKC